MFSQEALPQDVPLKEPCSCLALLIFSKQMERNRLTGMNKINPQTQIFHPVFVYDIFYWLHILAFLEVNFIKINIINAFLLIGIN